MYDVSIIVSLYNVHSPPHYTMYTCTGFHQVQVGRGFPFKAPSFAQKKKGGRRKERERERERGWGGRGRERRIHARVNAVVGCVCYRMYCIRCVLLALG